MGKLGKMRDAWLKAQAKSLKQSKETGLAFLRQGASEVASALYGSGTVAQGSAEYGMPWTRLPSQVADGMNPEEAAKSKPQQETKAPEPNEPELEIE